MSAPALVWMCAGSFGAGYVVGLLVAFRVAARKLREQSDYSIDKIRALARRGRP